MLLANYAQSILDPESLAKILKEKVEHRLNTKDQTRHALQEIRKGVHSV